MVTRANGKVNGEKVDTEKERRYCLPCKRNRRLENDFYESKNPLSSIDGKMVICKDCTSELFNNDIESMIRILRVIDKPFRKEIWDQAYNHKNKTFGTYISLLNGSQHNLGNATFDDSDEFVFNRKENNPSLIVDDDFEVTNEMRRRWLGHKDDSDIRFLEAFYQRMISSYECDTPMQEQLYMNIATTQLEANKTLLKGEIAIYEKLMKTISSQMNDAKVKPFQDGNGNSENLNTWGVWVKKIEETEPIPEPREEFKDVDNIWKYVKRWFVDHFARVLDLKQDDGGHEEASESHGDE